ncbi:Panacea domain-containing protein [Salinicoccus roseus]|uniref:Panacea domain-containing protein n=1 Tax=Salinicoccus roseus TaxID=45670 RepID=UPI00230008DA|nr:type II toxin-antitoxin system antitoxin SocA domain-containing protein [Salinicoccus roseus]
MAKAELIAKYLIKRAREYNISDVSPLKLQKLLYLAYEEFVKVHRRPLFNGDFEVWRHGPVVRNIYDEYKVFGSEVISLDTSVKESELTKDTKEIVNKVINEHGHKSAWDLVDETHRKDGPWYIKMERGESIIEFDDIKKVVEK